MCKIALERGCVTPLRFQMSLALGNDIKYMPAPSSFLVHAFLFFKIAIIPLYRLLWTHILCLRLTEMREDFIFLRGRHLTQNTS